MKIGKGGHGQRHGKSETPDVSNIQHPDVMHEADDVNVRGIVQFIVGLFLFGVIVVVLMAIMFKLLENRETEDAPRPMPMAFKPDESQMPDNTPRLQGAPNDVVEGENLHLKEPAAEREVVNRKWQQMMKTQQVDSQTGANITIPVEQAMQQVLQQGLPSRPPAAGQSDSGAAKQYAVEMPTFQSSGRMAEKRVE